MNDVQKLEPEVDADQKPWDDIPPDQHEDGGFEEFSGPLSADDLLE